MELCWHQHVSCVCTCVYLRCLNDNSYTFRLQSLKYCCGNLLSESLLNWRRQKLALVLAIVWQIFKNICVKIFQSKGMHLNLTLKPSTENLHYPGEIRNKRKKTRQIRQWTTFLLISSFLIDTDISSWPPTSMQAIQLYRYFDLWHVGYLWTLVITTQ